MDSAAIHGLSASDAARRIREGAIDAEQLTAACLDRVREVDGEVEAWAYLDPEHAMREARARDAERRVGRPLGPLHGVPVGVKDIFDTGDMPTGDGTVLHAGRTPRADAAVVAALRAAGAIVMGKTVTTELATQAPGKTRNPHDPERTPGGSSSGSAAAVAAGMVPLAIGSQTNGSIVRPAAFCGVYGYKPSFGLVPRTGMLRVSRTLDQIGVFARTLEDVALAVEQLVGWDEGDPDTRPQARPPLVATAADDPPLLPLLAFVRGPAWDRATDDTREAFAELAEVLGDRMVEIPLPESAQQALDWHRTIMEAEMAANLDREWDDGRDRLSPALREQLARGRAIGALEYQRARARIPQLNEGFADIFERCAAIVTPAAPGTAPGRETTGDPAFCTLWTLCGMPALSLPLMHGEHGLPIGVQLVGPRNDDARLLRTARWLATRLEDD